MQRADAFDEMRRQGTGYGEPDAEASDGRETLLNCLERCTGELTPANRDLIAKYYIGNERLRIENRRSLAERLGITMNAVSIRACRIRDKLEACVRQCAAAIE